MQERLHLDKSKDDPLLAEKIIKLVPKNSRLSFVGLGEPLMPIGQTRTIKILEKRPDISGFIQTNGSFKIKDELAHFIKKKRLEVGISYDTHHTAGQKVPIRIQKELVHGMAMSLSSIPINLSLKKLKEEFPNLNRILIEPLLDKTWDKPFISWEEVFNFCKKIKKEDSSIIIYMEISRHWKESKMIKKAEEGKEVIKNWYKMPGGFYIYLDDYTKTTRIMIDSRILEDSSRAMLPWKDLEDELIPIENFFAN